MSEQGSLAQYLVLLKFVEQLRQLLGQRLDHVDGPVHDNNANGRPENVLWKSAAGTLPMFNYTGSDAYTTSGPERHRVVERPVQQSGTPQVVTNADGSQTNQWLNVAAGGAGSVAYRHARRAVSDLQPPAKERRNRRGAC